MTVKLLRKLKAMMTGSRPVAAAAAGDDTDIFRLIVEQSHDAVIIHTDMVIVYAAGKSLDHFGYPDPALMMGRNIGEFMDAELQTRVRKRLEESASTGRTIPFIEIELLTRDRRSVPVEIASMPTTFRGRPSHLALIRDITNRRYEEQRFNENREKLSQIFMLSPEAITITSLDEGRFMDVNEAFLNIMNYSRDQVIGRTGAEINLWVYPHEKDRLYHEIAEKGYCSNLENHYRTGRGDVVLGLASARIIDVGGKKCIMAITRDITERKQMELKLHESEEKFSRAFRLSPDSLVISRVADGRIIDVNEGFCTTMGYNREEIIGNTTFALNMWDDISQRQKAVEMLGAKGEFSSYEAVFRRRDGTTIIGIMSARIMEINNERCMLSITRDITAEKELQKQLAESEEKFSRIYRLSPDAITITRVTDGKYIDINDAFTGLLGFTREEAIGRTSLELGIWENPEERSQLVERLRRDKEISNLQFHFRGKNGLVRVGSTSGRLLEIGGEICILLIVRDITDRLRSEQALVESEEKFSRIFRMSPDTMVISTLSDGRYLDANEEFTRQMGYSLEEAIGRTSQELGIWADYSERDRMAALLQTRGEVKGEEFHFRGKDGVVKTGEMSARVIRIGGEPCLIGMIRDISERKRSEEALRASEERYRTLFLQAPIGIISYSVDLRVVECNDRMSRILGMPAAAMIDFDLKNMADRRILECFMSGLQGETGHYEGEYGSAGEGGVFISMTSVPLRDNAGAIGGAYALVEDITERWRAREALNELTLNLERKVRERTAQLAASNEELEAFAYSVSHDLRAPLRSMDGFSQALVDDYGGNIDAQGLDYLERIRTSSRRMGQLIDDLLRLFRVTRAGMDSLQVNLSSMAREIIGELRSHDPGRNVEFICNGEYMVRGDPSLLRIALTNLLGNAWKFTGMKDDARIELGMVEDEKGQFYFIRDNGAGFDQTYAHRLFGPFQRLHTTAEFEGNGIGLAMVKKIIRRHGGSIRAEGIAGQGARFSFAMDDRFIGDERQSGGYINMGAV